MTTDHAPVFPQLHSLHLPATQLATAALAIALHTSPGIAERRQDPRRLPTAGDGAHPGGCVVAQAQATPQKAPRYSIAGELVRARDTAPHLTQLEAGAAASRWNS